MTDPIITRIPNAPELIHFSPAVQTYLMEHVRTNAEALHAGLETDFAFVVPLTGGRCPWSNVENHYVARGVVKSHIPNDLIIVANGLQYLPQGAEIDIRGFGAVRDNPLGIPDGGLSVEFKKINWGENNQDFYEQVLMAMYRIDENGALCANVKLERKTFSHIEAPTHISDPAQPWDKTKYCNGLKPFFYQNFSPKRSAHEVIEVPFWEVPSEISEAVCNMAVMAFRAMTENRAKKL